MRFLKLGYDEFRSLIRISRAKPFPPANDASAHDYIALYEQFISRRPQDEYDHVHAVRFRETAKVFGTYLEGGKRIVELGGYGRIGLFAREILGACCQAYEGELREPFDLADRAFDVVLCLEVVEHMKDRPSLETDQWPPDREYWNYSGALNLLAESHRILQPGGYLLLTTPNATSLDTIAKILGGDHPFMFDPHVRELAPKQVKAFAEHVGFTLEKFGTFFAWTECSQELREKISKIIADLGFDPANRGDDAYYVFRR